jgi:putative transposase
MQVSMDGRGRALDNVFIERLWRTVKYDNIYLKNYESVVDLRSGLTEFFHFYTQERPHRDLDGRTPWRVYNAAV